MKLLALATALLAALLLAGCSGGSGTGPVEPKKDAEGRYEIQLLASSFAPANAKVPAGATVLWKVNSGVHDVSATDGSFDSDTELGKKLQPNDTYTHTFPKAGTFEYVCDIHASTGMKATLVVE